MASWFSSGRCTMCDTRCRIVSIVGVVCMMNMPLEVLTCTCITSRQRRSNAIVQHSRTWLSTPCPVATSTTVDASSSGLAMAIIWSHSSCVSSACNKNTRGFHSSDFSGESGRQQAVKCVHVLRQRTSTRTSFNRSFVCSWRASGDRTANALVGCCRETPLCITTGCGAGGVPNAAKSKPPAQSRHCRQLGVSRT